MLLKKKSFVFVLERKGREREREKHSWEKNTDPACSPGYVPWLGIHLVTYTPRILKSSFIEAVNNNIKHLCLNLLTDTLSYWKRSSVWASMCPPLSTPHHRRSSHWTNDWKSKHAAGDAQSTKTLALCPKGTQTHLWCAHLMNVHPAVMQWCFQWLLHRFQVMLT